MQKTDGVVDQSACGCQPVATCVVPQLNDLIRMGSYTNCLIYTASIYRHLIASVIAREVGSQSVAIM